MIVVAGESLIDVVIDRDGDSTETAGGSPLNVAVGLGRLDIRVTLISQTGHDERGGLVVQHVTASDVEIVAAPTGSGRTSVATAQLAADGGASYVFDLEWDLPRQELPVCHALHVGSLGTLLEPGRQSVLDLVEQACSREVFVSYDANLRESFIDGPDSARRDVLALAQRCTLVKLSDEDAEALGEDPDDFARALTQGERTQLVILTRGSSGATAFTGTGEVSVQPRSVEVVDTVGAGDAFMAATLAQLDDLGAFSHPTHGLPLEGEELRQLLRGSMEVAAITCERRGANPPRRSELPAGWPA